MSSDRPNVHGERNYEGSRAYSETARKPVEAGGAEEARADKTKREDEKDSRRSEKPALLRPKEQKPPVPSPSSTTTPPLVPAARSVRPSPSKSPTASAETSVAVG